MAKTLSLDLRTRLIDAVKSGLSRRAAAARFAVGVSTAIRWVGEFQTSGRTAAKPKGGRPAIISHRGVPRRHFRGDCGAGRHHAG